MGRRLTVEDELQEIRQRLEIIQAGVRPDATDINHRRSEIRRLLRERSTRTEFFHTDYFSEAAWDMLLDLTLARLEQRSTCVTSLCVAASVPVTTALRWIAKLEDQGMVLRRPDPKDHRRSYLDMSDFAYDLMIRYLDRVSQAKRRDGAAAGNGHAVNNQTMRS
jgi:hypothetical protein